MSFIRKQKCCRPGGGKLRACYRYATRRQTCPPIPAELLRLSSVWDHFPTCFLAGLRNPFRASGPKGRLYKSPGRSPGKRNLFLNSSPNGAARTIEYGRLRAAPLGLVDDSAVGPRAAPWAEISPARWASKHKWLNCVNEESRLRNEWLANSMLILDGARLPQNRKPIPNTVLRGLGSRSGRFCPALTVHFPACRQLVSDTPASIYRLDTHNDSAPRNSACRRNRP